MSFFKDLLSIGVDVSKDFIGYGNQKKDGSHDHRYNTGKDRTTAQKLADKARRKNS